MSAGGRAGPPRHVPTLTEVVDPPALPRTGVAAEERDGDTLRRLAEGTAVPPATVAPPAPVAPPAAGPGSPPAAPAAIDEAALRQRLAGELQRRVEDVLAARLERRVHEVLAPTLARITEALVLETREQLAETLRELVAEAVAAERARQTPR